MSYSQPSASGPEISKLRLFFREHPLLACGATLFNVVSAYTTMRGMQLVFDEGDYFLRILAPWFVAIGLATLLMHFTAGLSARTRGQRQSPVVMGYLAVAITSIFFNFSAIYASMSLGASEMARYASLRISLLAEAQHAKHFLESELAALDRQVAEAKTEADFERDRPDRRGTGERWIPLAKNYNLLLSTVPIKKQSFVGSLSELKKQFELPSIALSNRPVSVEETQEAMESLKEVARRVSAVMAPYDWGRAQELERLSSEVEDLASPASSLAVLADSVKSLVSGSFVSVVLQAS
jgi:hypothetical protein